MIESIPKFANNIRIQGYIFREPRKIYNLEISLNMFTNHTHRKTSYNDEITAFVFTWKNPTSNSEQKFQTSRGQAKNGKNSRDSPLLD